ncbi:MAG TPA: terminase small subunit [Bacteroidales bacterium]|nr:terminase small subunit [Bacteroidales bacterium]
MKRDLEEVTNQKKLTPKEERFCYEYCIDLNATQAAIRAGYSKKTARSIGSRLLTNVDVYERIKEMKTNLSETAGISALKVLLEHKKLAYSSFSEIHETWYKRVDFEKLDKSTKDCISEIETKIRTEWEYNPDTEKKEPIRVEYVRIKLYDKQKALDSISKMLGYDAPVKAELTGKGGRDLIPENGLSGLSIEELKQLHSLLAKAGAKK